MSKQEKTTKIRTNRGVIMADKKINDLVYIMLLINSNFNKSEKHRYIYKKNIKGFENTLGKGDKVIGLQIKLDCGPFVSLFWQTYKGNIYSEINTKTPNICRVDFYAG